MWAACVRYVSSPQITRRMGSGDGQFLLVKFPKVQFAEVTVREDAHWEVLEHSSNVTTTARDLEIDFHRTSMAPPPSPLVELSTGQFPDFSEGSSGTNSTLDFHSISEDDLSRSEQLRSRLTPLQVSKVSSMVSPDISPIATSKYPHGHDLDLIRSQSTRSGVSSSQESGSSQKPLPTYEIFESTLEF